MQYTGPKGETAYDAYREKRTLKPRTQSSSRFKYSQHS